MSNGKGSKRRPRSSFCSADDFDKRWEKAFSKEEDKEEDKKDSTLFETKDKV